jgi:DNA polymerase-3 subunit alpha
MSVLVFDVETTGLPVRESLYKRMPDPKKFEFYNEARIVELAYKIFDSQDRLVKAVSVLIKPEIEITNSDIHGITTQMATEFGSRMDIALAHFLIDLDNVDSIVSHNMEFDKNLVLSEMWRLVSTGNNGYNINYLDIETLTNKPSVCTMKLGQTKLNYTKYPKLIELFKTLCGNKTWKQDHRALDDVDKCAQCYFKLKN